MKVKDSLKLFLPVLNKNSGFVFGGESYDKSNVSIPFRNDLSIRFVPRRL